ncbi:MAG: deoxyribodipyrimidine photo-lyase [Xanthobacteraceae bacterium]|uniref:cryptochrome/photolyase family protein n=1 Tax=Pseudolabrys sp. TaxID=1960880 RepID=UPI003D0FBE59
MAERVSVLHWFRDDLRLHDNPALSAAVRGAAPLVCLYVRGETGPAVSPAGRPHSRPLGSASRWWLAQSLRALDAALGEHRQRLVLRSGEPVATIVATAREARATRVHWNRGLGAACRALDRALIEALREAGIGATVHAPNLLAGPTPVTTKDGGPMRVFTPFWRRLRTLGPSRTPLAAPGKLARGPDLTGERLADWALEPSRPDWAGGLRAAWTPGEDGARQRLSDFLKQAAGYAAERDRPDRAATSRLSPHLRFGEISAGEVFNAAQFMADEGQVPGRDIDKFHSELGWRDFSYSLLQHNTDLAIKNLQPRFDAFPWRDDAAGLRAWQRGRTGYPIVDAGMRELWTTGWMHNRVRMIVASFLVKHLLIDWRHGEQWFWDTLVDADPANNPASWQWVAGCGADAAPYFRIFNPVLQGRTFDPEGDYVRRWVPELGKLRDDDIHSPWLATPLDLADAGVTLGKNYPQPIVDHAAARARALEAFKATKSEI